MAAAIPQIHHEAILERVANGANHREIAAWLAEAHGIKVAHTTVGRLIANIRAEREPVKQAIIAEKTAKSVGKDLDVLGEMQSTLLTKWRNFGKKGAKLREFLEVGEQLRSVTNDKLRAAGAGKDENTTTTAAAIVVLPPEKPT